MYDQDIARLRHRIEELEATIQVKDEKFQRLNATVVESEVKIESAHALEVQLKVVNAVLIYLFIYTYLERIAMKSSYPLPVTRYSSV